RFFLPDLCTIRMVLAIVLIGELLAFVLVVGGWSEGGTPWDRLGLTSLFIQWVALSSAALLCLMRRLLCRLTNLAAGTISYLLVLGVILAFSEIAYAIGEVAGVPITGGRHLGFILRNLAVGAIFSAVILRLFYLQNQQRLSVEAHAQARIEALQARIRPHFLFNSINTIAALIRRHPERAEEALEDLADLFRRSLADPGGLVPLAEELESARRYLHMEKLRLGERLNVDWQPGALPDSAGLPPLTLQPLLENAIYHGIEVLPEGGTVALRGRVEDGQVNLMVSNPLPISREGGRPGQQLALDNISERLRLAFGRSGKLGLEKTAGQCRVELSFPVMEQEDEGTNH
ncbi:MAG: sensor histidine kinase, partial [Gammaproteobacteria bacterium]|nr:sensor histidine kinase [Gammaproteobacteria bacterium]NIR97761.1 sensor histidine kinase [Gammaproteobacteria bacterium]NIT63471.1 sensor histidine kinase [Gammaproteobacteria bacterium]NIX10921.1 sensor histidine kinase [Gammaproteobacteria bacterium]NIY32051.1 sensor histidine kinase [Gammaproteobacteria bacterium]